MPRVPLIKNNKRLIYIIVFFFFFHLVFGVAEPLQGPNKKTKQKMKALGVRSATSKGQMKNIYKYFGFYFFKQT
jgi:hypothetical protein